MIKKIIVREISVFSLDISDMDDNSNRLHEFYCELLNRILFDNKEFEELVNSEDDLRYMTASDLSDSFYSFSLNTILNDSDWDTMAELIRNLANNVRNKKVLTVDQKQQLIGELIDRCKRLPHRKVVENKLGRKVAEEYQMWVEELETNPLTAGGRAEINVLSVDDSKRWNRQQVNASVQYVKMLASEDPVQQYIDYRRLQSQRNREQRIRLRKQNHDIIMEAARLHIWFPYTNNKEQQAWSRSMPKESKQLYRLMTQLRTSRPRHPLVQYIPKRKCTAKTMNDIHQNMNTLKRYFKLS